MAMSQRYKSVDNESQVRLIFYEVGPGLAQFYWDAGHKLLFENSGFVTVFIRNCIFRSVWFVQARTRT